MRTLLVKANAAPGELVNSPAASLDSRALIWAGLVFLALFAAGCGSTKAAAPAQRATPPPVVRAGVVAVETVPVYGEFTGQTDAKETVNVIPRVTGYLEKVSLREGSQIHQGDVLFQIEQANYKAALESAEARLAQDQATLEKYRRDIARLTPLVKEQAATQQDLDTATAGRQQTEAALRGDQAAIDTARLNLQYTVIRSPVDGIAGRLGVTLGNYVTAGQATALATISSVDPIYVYFSVPEVTYLAFHKEFSGRQSSANVQLVLADGRPFAHSGSIDFIDRAADPQTGTVGLRARFPNPDALLRPGQFARVKFLLERRVNAVLIPKEAITQTLTSRSVLVLDDKNKVSLRPVTTDGDYGEYYIVGSGLQGGERIVVEGTQKARPGMTVQLAPANGRRGA
jgi:RND family efflux transporter MFP subunit